MNNNCQSKRLSRLLKGRRSRSAFSLITVTIVGLLATMWLSATTAGMLQVYQNTNSGKYTSMLLSTAESANDYVIAQLNSNSRSNYDPGSTLGSTKTISNLSGTAWGAPADATLLVTVKSVAPSSSSIVYDAQLDANVSQSGTAMSYDSKSGKWVGNGSSNYTSWRVVQTTASYNGYSKTVSAALRPIYSASSLTGGSVSRKSQTYFGQAALATSNIMLGADTITSGYDSSVSTNPWSSAVQSSSPPPFSWRNVSLGGDIVSYGNATIDASGGRVMIGGSLTVPSTPSLTNVTGTNTPTVNRYLMTTGNQNGGFGSYFNGDFFNNVLGGYNQSAGFPANQSTFLQTDVSTSNLQPTQLPPAPTAPMSSSGQFSNVTEPTTGGSISVTSSTTANPGDYVADSLSISSGTSISVGSSTQPVRVFINGNNNASDVVQINGYVNSGGYPANFQIWYNGTGTLEIRSPSMAATIYAPNARVLMGNNTGGSNYTFDGAVVAKEIGGNYDASTQTLSATQNLRLHYDIALGNVGKMSPSQGQSMSMSNGGFSSTTPFMQAVSYNESRANH